MFNTYAYKFYIYIGTPVITSERAMHKQQKELIKDYGSGEMVPLQFPSTAANAVNGFVMRHVPFVKVNNLCAMIFDCLDRLKE